MLTELTGPENFDALFDRQRAKNAKALFFIAKTDDGKRQVFICEDTEYIKVTYQWGKLMSETSAMPEFFKDSEIQEKQNG